MFPSCLLCIPKTPSNINFCHFPLLSVSGDIACSIYDIVRVQKIGLECKRSTKFFFWQKKLPITWKRLADPGCLNFIYLHLLHILHTWHILQILKVKCCTTGGDDMGEKINPSKLAQLTLGQQ